MDDCTQQNMFIPQIQKKCLDIVIEIDRICRENGINYSLCGGSVIGAHLYRGFIPWDDDIDLMMTRENYEKFLEVFSEYKSEKYHILNYRYDKVASVPTLFTRIEDTDTITVEEIAGKVRNGHVFVDITVFDGINSNFKHKYMCLYGGYVYSKLYSINGMIPGTKWKRILFKVASINLNEKRALLSYKKYENKCSKTMNNNCEIYAELLSAAYSKYVYPNYIFENYLDIEFENQKFMVVEKYMDYLFLRYGKREFQREVPPDKRFNSHIKDFYIKEN